jgi:hypothetical protein
VRGRGGGRGALYYTHPGPDHYELVPGAARPSRWNTLRALRVLRWFDGASS